MKVFVCINKSGYPDFIGNLEVIIGDEGYMKSANTPIALRGLQSIIVSSFSFGTLNIIIIYSF